MRQIVKRKQEDLNILLESEVSFENVLKMFLEKADTFLYIVDSDRIFLGIITLGTFSRNLSHPLKWLNRGCVYLIDDQEHNLEKAAERVLDKNICEVPVLDGNHRLCGAYGYQKKKNEEEKIISEAEKRICQQREYIKSYIQKNKIKKMAISQWKDFPVLQEILGEIDQELFCSFEEMYKNNFEQYEDVFKKLSEEQCYILVLTEAEVRILKAIAFKYKINLCVESFGTFLEKMERIQELEKLVNFWKKHHIHFLFYASPKLSEIKNLSDYEKNKVEGEIRLNGDVDEKIKKYKTDFEKILGERATEDYLKKLSNVPRIIEQDNLWKLEDFHTELVNTQNGYRVTTDQPDEWEHSIYIFGPCMVAGLPFAEDADTIASFLQRKINKKKNEKQYRVVNCGISSLTDQQLIRQLMHQEFSEGDTVVVIFRDMPDAGILNFFHSENITVKSLSSLFERPHKYGDWFFDEPRHTCYRGNEVIAEQIFKELVWEKNIYLKNTVALMKKNQNIENEELNKYIENLKTVRKVQLQGDAGAIVMNANPFTLGHRYLIEKALEQCSILYVFVVEEDKSKFSFETRFQLVKEGSSDLKNVVVLPSGKFIISALTFPEYFRKDVQNDIVIDVSKDLSLFGTKIAPALNITKRFVGEEPADYITNQYNRSMMEILPEYGIEVIEIERKKSNTSIISASLVRKAVEEGNWKKLHTLVPETTFRYLYNRNLSS